MSRPSNSQPSQAAIPDFHCCGDRSRTLRISSRELEAEPPNAREPGDAGELGPGAARFERLQQRPGSREALFLAPSRAIEDDIGTVTTGQSLDGGNRIVVPGVQGDVRTELP